MLVGGGSGFEGRETLGIVVKVNDAVAFGGQERSAPVVVDCDLHEKDVTRTGKGVFKVVNQVRPLQCSFDFAAAILGHRAKRHPVARTANNCFRTKIGKEVRALANGVGG